MPSDCSVGNAFGPLRDFFCKFAIASRFVQCVWHSSPRFPSRTAVLANIEHFTHQSLYKIAHPERFFKIFWPARPSGPLYPGQDLNRLGPDSDLTHAAAPLQVSCWPDPEVRTVGSAGPLTEVDLPCRRSEWHGSF